MTPVRLSKAEWEILIDALRAKISNPYTPNLTECINLAGKLSGALADYEFAEKHAKGDTDPNANL